MMGNNNNNGLPSPGLGSSPNPINQHSSNITNTATLIRNHLSPKWKLYWCVLVKDVIVFYKNQDEKTPVDFLLLKDFSILLPPNRELAFILVDRSKQLEHEFYAQTADEFREWIKVYRYIESFILKGFKVYF